MTRFPTTSDRLCGVIHLDPTPGSAGWGCAGQAGRGRGDGESSSVDGAMARLLERAVGDAQAYAAGRIRTVVVENFHDAPFDKGGVGAATVAAMALAVARVRAVEGIDAVGINVLRNDAHAALGLAAATGAAFVRVNVHTGSMYTDQGLIEGRAAETLRERARLGLGARLFADVHVKHASPVAGERLEDAARDAARRGRADGLVVSGVATGSPPDRERIARVRAAVGDEVPLLVGSGLTVDNAAELLAVADGAFVGTSVKEDGDVRRPVDPARVASLAAAAAAAEG